MTLKNIFILATILLLILAPTSLAIKRHTEEPSTPIAPPHPNIRQPSDYYPNITAPVNPSHAPRDISVEATDNGSLPPEPLFAPLDPYAPMSDILDLPSSWCLLINASGYHKISSSIQDCSSDVGIFINGSDIVFDGTNHTVDGAGTASNRWGIYILNSNNVTIYNLTLSDWVGSILIYNSTNITISTTVLQGGGILVVNSYNNTIEDTTLNGKTVVYLEGASDVVISANVGQIILVNSNNITVSGGDMSNALLGVELWNTNNSMIMDSTISSVSYGVYAYGSYNNTFDNLTVLAATWGVALLESGYNVLSNLSVNSSDYAVYIEGSRNNTIRGLKAINCDVGVYSYSSTGNLIEDSIISGGVYGAYLNASLGEHIENSEIGVVDWGVFIYRSNYTYVGGNNITGDLSGVRLVYSYGTRIISNNFEKNGLSLLESYGSEVENNFVGGRPLVYFEDAEGVHIDFQAGQIVLLNSRAITIELQNISNIREAIIIIGSSQVSLSSSYISAISVGIRIENSSDVAIRDSTIETAQHCLEILDSRGVSVEYTNVSDGTEGIYIENSTDVSIVGGEITFNDVGVYATNSKGLYMAKVRVANSGSKGVELRSCNDTLIADSRFSRDDTAGVYSYQCYGLTIMDSSFDTSDYGIELSYSQQVFIRNSSFWLLYDQGIYVERSNGVIIKESKFHDTGSWFDGSAIYVYYSSNTTIIGNFMFYEDPLNYNYGPAYGVYVEYSENTTISNNTIWYQGYQGIYIVGSGAKVLNNQIMFVARIGIGIHGADNLVANNTILSTTIGVYLDYGRNNIIISNTIRHASGTGVLVWYGMNNSVLWNTIEDSMYGIAIRISPYNTIVGNTVESSLYGVHIRGDNNTIYLNTFIDIIYSEYYIYSGSGNRFYSPEQMGYFYRGSEFWGYLGNYWSGYLAADLNGDGIGDVPYGDDAYPLVGIPRLINGSIVISAPPKISILKPQNNTIFSNGVINLTWSTQDYEGDISRIDIIIDGDPLFTLTPNTTSVLLGLQEGTHTITVRVVDSLGNTDSESVRIIVDSTAPTISIISPKDKTTMNTTIVTVIFNASDNREIDHYDVIVDGQQIYTGLPPETTNITLNLTEGIHEITIRAYDQAGNSAEDTIIIIVKLEEAGQEETGPTQGTTQNTEQGETPSGSNLWIYIVATILVTGIVVGALILRKRGTLG